MGYARSEIFVKEIIERHSNQKIYGAFMKLYNNSKQTTFKSSFIKKVVNNQWAKRMRKLFYQWKNNSDKLDVAYQCHEFGVVRQEVNLLKRDIKNLRSLLVDDGYKLEEIDKILAMDNEKYLQILEKSLCRLFCAGKKHEGKGLHLLPYCFDKIKKNR